MHKIHLFISDQVKSSIFMGKVDPRRPPGVQARVLAKRRINAERNEISF